MRKKILAAVAVMTFLLVGLLVVVAVQPDEFTISRSATMAAPPEEVFAQVNDFHNWEAWSPWAKLDPDSTAEYSGPESGKGAAFSWSGNSEVGEGTMTILESRPHELIRINLEFTRPFADTSTAEFTFRPEGDQTVVTWSMMGQNSFIEKGFCLLMDMDEMLGEKFNEGLASMKAIVEADAAGPAGPDADAETSETGAAAIDGDSGNSESAADDTPPAAD